MPFVTTSFIKKMCILPPTTTTTTTFAGYLGSYHKEIIMKFLNDGREIFTTGTIVPISGCVICIKVDKWSFASGLMWFGSETL